MAFLLGYPDAQSVAHVIRDELSAHGIEPLRLLPYNHHDKLKVSTWWVSVPPPPAGRMSASVVTVLVPTTI